MCDTQAYVPASDGAQCKECQAKQDQATETPIVKFDPWPPCRPPFIRSKYRDHDAEVMENLEFTEEDKKMSVQSSKFIAQQLADYDEIGFKTMRTSNHSSRMPRDWCIYQQAIERLAFIADNRRVPYQKCVAAAQCGGLPMLADVNDATYGAVVRKLTRCMNMDSDLDVSVLINATDQRLACYCRAALAAALVVYNFENRTTDVKEGCWGAGDIPTRHEYVAKVVFPQVAYRGVCNPHPPGEVYPAPSLRFRGNECLHFQI